MRLSEEELETMFYEMKNGERKEKLKKQLGETIQLLTGAAKFKMNLNAGEGTDFLTEQAYEDSERASTAIQSTCYFYEGLGLKEEEIDKVVMESLFKGFVLDDEDEE